MKYLILTTVIIVMAATASRAQQAYFINSVGDTLYSRCCEVNLVDKALTPHQERIERKQYRKDKKAGRYFNRVVKAYIRRDMREMRKHSKQPAL